MVESIELIKAMISSTSDSVTYPWVAEYRDRGFVKLEAVFSQQEINDLSVEYDRLFADPDILREDSLRSASRESLISGTVLDRLDPVIDLSQQLKDFTQDSRILNAVGAAIGEPARLFKDKAIMKPPGAYGYSVHQDFTNWQELPVPPELLITALVAIDPGTAENGGLKIYPGLHHQHLGPEEKPGDIFNPKAGLVPDELLGVAQPELVTVQPGDLVLFSSLAPHFSGPNRSDHKRRTLFLSYNAARFGDVYDLYYRNLYGYLKKDRQLE
jgi:ectoine hydroxylase-related dioxygenase (phytanoyl-CoA dioxygenase family)